MLKKIIGPFTSSEKIGSFCQLFISPNQPSTKQMYQRLFLRSPDKNRVVVLVVHHQFSELALETKHTLGPQMPCSTFDCLTYSCDQSIAAAAAAATVVSSLLPHGFVPFSGQYGTGHKKLEALE